MPLPTITSMADEENAEIEKNEEDEEEDPIEFWVDPLPNSSLEKLQFELEELEEENKVREHETQTLAKYVAEYMQGEEYQVPKESQTTRNESKRGSRSNRLGDGGSRSANFRRTKGRSASRQSGTAIAQVTTLTTEQKLTLSSRIMGDRRKELEALKLSAEREMDSMKALCENAICDGDEIEKQAQTYYHMVKTFGRENGGTVMPSETLIRYFEERIKVQDQLIGKFRLKASAMIAQRKNINTKLLQKEQTGDQLEKVDFDQLQIANQKFNATIDERNHELLKLKQSSADVIASLNRVKDNLAKLSVESERLQDEVKSRNNMLGRLEKEGAEVNLDKDKAIRVNEKLRKQLKDFEVPSVLEYAQSKESLLQQRKNKSIWERRLKIAQNELRALKTKWNTSTS